MYAYCNNHPVGTADYDGHVAVGASIALDLLLKLLIELVISAGCTYMIYEAVDSISGKQEQVPSYDEFKNQSKQDKKANIKKKRRKILERRRRPELKERVILVRVVPQR